MSAPIPQFEPTSHQAGNSLVFTKSLSDYPASGGWTLNYYARSIAPTASQIDFSGAADGDDFSISIAAATTAQWVAGSYTLAGYVTLGTDRFLIYQGRFSISTDIAQVSAGQAFDGRTYWERIRDQLQLEIENGAIRTVIRYSYNGVSTEVVTMEDAFKALAYVDSKVAQEQAPAGRNRKILTRFSIP